MVEIQPIPAKAPADSNWEVGQTGQPSNLSAGYVASTGTFLAEFRLHLQSRERAALAQAQAAASHGGAARGEVF